jgi:RHS repeat-associated protein
VRSNDLYAWNGHGSGTTSSTANGLNQLATHAGVTPTYDARGNLTSDGTYGYTYSSENLLKSFSTSGTLNYDPLMRFYENYSSFFIHDGGQLIGNYYNGNIVERTVPGPGTDEPLVSVNKFGARTWYHADERGSVIAGSNSTGANAGIVLFDEYGKRGPGGSYRFGFTGQVHLLNDIYDYKARNYNARLGRFVQADPIGLAGGTNMYGYVGGDPVNFTDPMGLKKRCPKNALDIVVCGDRGESDSGPTVSGGAALLGASRSHGGVGAGGNGKVIPCAVDDSNCATVNGQPKLSVDPSVFYAFPEALTYHGFPAKNSCTSGPVLFGSLGGEGYLGFGGGISGGGYIDSGTGEMGVFGAGESTAVAWSGSIGYGASIGGQFGIASNISSFNGPYSVIGLGVGPLSINYSFARDNFMAPISLSIGPSLNAMPFPLVPGSFHYSQGNTSLARLRNGSC